MYDVKYPFYARYSSSTRPGVWCRAEETCETDEQHPPFEKLCGPDVDVGEYHRIWHSPTSGLDPL